MGDSGKARKRVLVVDDEARLLTFVEIRLRLAGYDVTMASSGQDGLDLVRRVKPDIVVLDVLMPGKDGFEVLRELRTFSRVPVIVFSARQGAAELAMSLGASAFLSKPFDPDDLVDRIRGLLGPGC